MAWRGRLVKMTKDPKKIKSLLELDKAITNCKLCPRLVDWREEVAITKRKSYETEKYWGKPIPGFGSERASLLIVGLAPGAHGANRTGRIFTGDRSGDWLFSSLYRNGLAKIAISVDRNDGQELPTSRIACAVRCAPPDNKPTTEEKAICAPWLHREMELLFPTLKSILVLGNFAWGATISVLTELGVSLPKPIPKFGHGANFKFKGKDGVVRLVIASYHPSQQNTFTGKLTEKQLDLVIKKAGRFAQLDLPS